MGKSTGIFITSLAVLIIFNFIMGASHITEMSLFSVAGLIGLLVTVIPVIILVSISAEFHVLGSGGSTEGFNPQTIRIIFTICALVTILFKLDLPAPIPFDLGLGLGTDVLTCFPIEAVGGIPFLIVSGIIITAFLSGIMVSVEGG